MFRRLCLVLVISVFTSFSFADTVHTIDGSTIVGKVVRAGDGNLTVETEFAGTLKIPLEKVAGIQTAEPVNVKTVGGDSVSGKLRYDVEKGQRLADAQPAEIPAVADLTLWRADAKSPEQLEAEKQRGNWLFEGAVGIEGETGNSERHAARGELKLKYINPDNRVTFYSRVRWAREDGVRTSNEAIAGVDAEHDISGKTFLFGRLEFEHDEFENLDLRTVATAGLGYFLVEREDMDLKVRGGLGYECAKYDDGSTEDDIVAELGVSLRKEISPWLNFTHSTTYYPTVHGLDDYRIEADTAAEIPLTEKKEWKLRLGMRNHYNSQPVGDSEKMDTNYYANLVFQIK